MTNPPTRAGVVQGRPYTTVRHANVAERGERTPFRRRSRTLAVFWRTRGDGRRIGTDHGGAGDRRDYVLSRARPRATRTRCRRRCLSGRVHRSRGTTRGNTTSQWGDGRQANGTRAPPPPPGCISRDPTARTRFFLFFFLSVPQTDNVISEPDVGAQTRARGFDFDEYGLRVHNVYRA